MKMKDDIQTNNIHLYMNKKKVHISECIRVHINWLLIKMSACIRSAWIVIATIKVIAYQAQKSCI